MKDQKDGYLQFHILLAPDTQLPSTIKKLFLHFYGLDIYSTIHSNQTPQDEKLKMYFELEPNLAVYATTKADLEIERLKIQQTKENKELREEMETLKIHLASQGMEILKKLQQKGKM